MKYKVITLCGSTKFKDEFLKQQVKLTLEGNIVIPLGIYDHHDNIGVSKNKELEEMLIEMHKQKIDMSDAIFVINVGGYIGKNTMSEIKYAQENKKEIIYLEHY